MTALCQVSLGAAIDPGLQETRGQDWRVTAQPAGKRAPFLKGLDVAADPLHLYSKKDPDGGADPEADRRHA